MIDYCEFSEDEFRKAFEYYYNALTSYKRPSEKPQACILGGQSGSGKSTIHKIIKEQNPNIIVIDGDRFREQHPNFEIIQKEYGNEAANYTQKFSNSIVNALIERLSSEKLNLVIEGTCRTSDVPLNTAKALKDKGYTVELSVMCTDKDISWQSTIDRYNEMKRRGLHARAVPKEKYLETVNAISANISTIYQSNIFDEITLYNREKQCLYRFSETPEINPSNIVDKMLNEIERKRKLLTESDEILANNPNLKVVVNRLEKEYLKDNLNGISEPEQIRLRFKARNAAINSDPNLCDAYKSARNIFRNCDNKIQKSVNPKYKR